MLFVLSGPSYVGKKTAIAHFMKLYSFSSIIPYTTKPYDHRVGETEGIQYHYVEEESRDDIANDDYIFDEPFNFDEYKETTLYAYKKIDIQNAIESYSNFIIHASVGNVQKMHDIFSQYHTKPNDHDDTWTQQIYFIFLNFKSNLTEDFFRQKQPKEMSDTAAENQTDLKPNIINNFESQGKAKAEPTSLVSSNDFKRRYSHAQKEVNFYKDFQKIFYTQVKGTRHMRYVRNWRI